LDTTNLLYTSDHGEAAGNHGMFGKSTLYEHSLGVPLIMRGPGIPKGRVVKEIVSHVDLFDTILESVGSSEKEGNHQRSGTSLWPAIRGETKARIGFSEVHVKSTKNDDRVKKLLMFVTDINEDQIKFGNRKPETVLLYLSGDIDLTQISKLVNKVNLPGGQQLGKLNEK